MRGFAEHNDAPEAIERLIARVRRRLRLRIGLEWATTAGVVAVLLACIALALWKTGWIGAAAFAFATAGLVLLPAAAFGSAWLRRQDPVALAQRIDQSHRLHDRLSTALALARNDGSHPFTEAQIRDAVDHLDRVDPTRAVPFDRPPDLAILGVCLAAFGALALVQPPSHAEPLPERPEIRHDPVLDEATIAVEKERVETMREKLEGSDDPETERLVDEIDELLEDVEQREISGEEFLDRLDEIEREHFEQMNAEQFEESVGEQFDQAADELREQAEQAGEQLDEHKQALEQAADALEQGDGEEASKALEKLAEQLADDEQLDDETVEKLADMLEQFSDDVDKHRDQLEKMLEQNKELADKLSEKLDRQGNLSERNRRRLDRAKDNVEQLRDRDGGEEDDGESEGNDRNLERLQRKSEQAADQMRERSGERGEEGGEGKGDEGREDESDYQNRSGRKAERKSGEQKERRQKKQQQGGRKGERGESEDVEQMARKQLEELRESMRRSRPEGSRSDDSENSRSGEGSDRGEKMREFLRRAKGDSEGEESGDEQQARRRQSDQNGDSRRDGRKGNESSSGEQGDSQGQKQAEKQGDSAGDQPGGEALGEEASSMKSKRDDSKVDGRKGPGESRSQVIRAASEKGFANREYKDVYGDYSPVVEEVMDREDVPPGYRYYVKRYFELIKPRD